jgi:hypothetical protein
LKLLKSNPGIQKLNNMNWKPKQIIDSVINILRNFQSNDLINLYDPPFFSVINNKYNNMLHS